MNTLTCLCPPFCRLSVEAIHIARFARPRWKLCAYRNVLQETALHDAEVNSYRHRERKNRKRDGAYIDKDGVARTFDRKKISRKRGKRQCYHS